jgi:WD40 repeat protein
MAANASQSHEELMADFSRRDEAFDSIKGVIHSAPLAAEKLRRLSKREIDRAEAASIYAAGAARFPGYEPLLEAYAYWMYYGVSKVDVGPWLGRECDKIGGAEGDELYARVAYSGSRASGNWIERRGLDWPRMQRGFWSLHRRWPGATDALDQLANAAVVCKDPVVLRQTLKRTKTPVRSVWSDNYGAYLHARRLAGLEKPSDLKPVAEVTPDRKQRLYRAAYSPDGMTLAIGGAKGELSLWSLPDLKLLWSDTNPHWISGLTYSPDGRWLAVAGGNFHDQTKGGNVRVWDMTTHTVAVTLDALPEWMNAAAFSPSGDTLWVGGGQNHGQLAVWRVGDAKIISLPSEDVPRAAIHDLVANDHEVYLAAWRQLWSLQKAEQGMALKKLREGKVSYASIALSPDGKRLAAGTWMNNDAWDTPAQIEVYDLARGFDRFNSLPVRGTKVEKIIFTRDGQRLLASSNASEVHMWTAGTRGAPVSFYADGWTIDAMAASPNSKQAATIDTSSVVRLWSLNLAEHGVSRGPVRRWPLK